MGLNLLFIIYLIVSICLIILVLAQKGKDSGFTTMSSAGENSARGNTFERKLQSWTKWLVLIYILFSIGLNYYEITSNPGSPDYLDEDIYEDENDPRSEADLDTADDAALRAQQENAQNNSDANDTNIDDNTDNNADVE